ncbi:helix-turn-helix domain-containing protein [bacterium]|nr:helix-turn-helix domain-containing protein [bacterium]
MVKILDADEVALMLKIPPRSVSMLAKNRELIGFKVSNRWRFRVEDVEEFVERRIREVSLHQSTEEPYRDQPSYELISK